jgi:hypothetical protein
MLVKRLVEGEESLQVAVLRIDGRGGLSSNLVSLFTLDVVISFLLFVASLLLSSVNLVL